MNAETEQRYLAAAKELLRDYEEAEDHRDVDSVVEDLLLFVQDWIDAVESGEL